MRRNRQSCCSMSSLEIDTVDGVKAVAALKQAKSVMAFTPFVSETLLDVCDVLLPIARY